MHRGFKNIFTDNTLSCIAMPHLSGTLLVQKSDDRPENAHYLIQKSLIPDFDLLSNNTDET
jgi:hypothetical protein